MKPSPASVSNQKTTKPILNAHTAAEQQAIGDWWADHKGPRMTLAEAMAHAARFEEEKEKQPAE